MLIYLFILLLLLSFFFDRYWYHYRNSEMHHVQMEDLDGQIHNFDYINYYNYVHALQCYLNVLDL